MLLSFLRDLFRERRKGSRAPDIALARAQTSVASRRVLNVGGAHKSIPIPDYFRGWDHVLLDIDPRGKPDIVCDARRLETLPAGQFDAVYCSHNLEHYYRHDCIKVLRGMHHLLKADGFVEIRVPDMDAVMRHVAGREMDIEDTLYLSPGGPISVRDVIYGWSREIEQSGNDFYAHKNGFTTSSLKGALIQAGFSIVMPFVEPTEFQLRALAFREAPDLPLRALLGLDP